jgi:DNA-binding response OmpR family regulator
MKSANVKRKSILVIEDELGIGKVCTRTLNAEGFQVEVALNGKVALDVLSQRRFDLCLVDIRTPEMNGIELYTQLQKIYPGMANKVVFTTGDVLASDIKSFLESTGRLYLAKPFSPDELVATVRAALHLV